MSYRIVILNGDRRGERLDITSAPLLIGTAASCPLRISDPGCAETHAELSLQDGGLYIRSLGEACSIQVNETILSESRLRHGDVIHIGTTRFFIQESAEPGMWGALSEMRKKRAWLTLGLPLLLMAGLAAILHQCRHEPPSPQATLTKPFPVATPENASDQPDDSLVTNIPRITVNPSVTITTRPPELVEAVADLNRIKTIPVEATVLAAREELERGTLFLEEKSTPAPAGLAATNREAAIADLNQAESSLRETTPPESKAADTNTPVSAETSRSADPSQTK